jgi:hypothetical protein
MDPTITTKVWHTKSSDKMALGAELNMWPQDIARNGAALPTA